MAIIFRLAQRSIRASIGRLVLTTIAIAASVGFVAGSFIIADSLSNTFNSLFDNILKTIDARVAVHEPEFGADEILLPDSLVDQVAALPEVGSATPELAYGGDSGGAPFAIIDDEGDKYQPMGPPIITFAWDGESVEGLLSLDQGVPPSGIDQAAIDLVQAEVAGVTVGDTVTMATPDGERQFEITALVEMPISVGAWFVLFDFPSAQVLYAKEGLVDEISLSRAPGVSVEEMIEAVEKIIPDDARVQNQSEVRDQEAAEFETIITVIRNALLAFAGLALFVSLFIIYNTFTILVKQRLQQIGMLRAVGATRRQIQAGIAIEALLVGLAGSIAGFGLGLTVATLIKAAFQANGGFPEVANVIETRTIFVSLGVGLVATMISALLPAVSAGRISPIAAMRNEPPSRTSIKNRVTAGFIVTGLGLVSLAAGLFVGGQGTATVLIELGAGAVLTFVGVSMLSVLFARPAVRMIGRPVVLGFALLTMGLLLPVLIFVVGNGSPSGISSTIMFGLKMLVSAVSVLVGISVLFNLATNRTPPVGPGGAAVGVAGRLARQNAARSPQRTAATATALTIGVAVVATVGIVGESLKSTISSDFRSEVNADLFLLGEQGGTLPGDLADSLESVDGIDAVSRFRANSVKVGDDVNSVVAYDSATGDDLVAIDLQSGTTDSLISDGVLVNEELSNEQSFVVGDTVELQFPTGGVAHLTVAGVYRSGFLISGDWVVDISTYENHVASDDDFAVSASISEGADPLEVQATTQTLVDEFGSGEAQTADEFLGMAASQVDSLITLINYLLGFALIVAFLGVINTIVLSVIERTREIGLLRAVGMTRTQVRSSIRWESVIVCLFGALLGVVLGILFSVAAVSAIPETVIDTISVPYESVLFVILAGALAGVLAALVPAYRATRLNVLDSIAAGG